MALTCASCRYFRAGVSSVSPARYRDGVGECRRHAPRGPVHLAWSQNDETHVVTLTPFPIVPADDWCGEHAQAEMPAQRQPATEGAP